MNFYNKSSSNNRRTSRDTGIHINEAEAALLPGSQVPSVSRNFFNRKPLIPFLLKVFCILGISILLWSYFILDSSEKEVGNIRNEIDFDRHFCRVPYIPLRSDSFLAYAEKPSISLCGNGEKITSFVNATTIKLVKPILRGTESKCIVYEVKRTYADSHDSYHVKTLGELNATGNEVSSIEGEHVVVTCTDAIGTTLGNEFHSRVIPMKPSLEPKINYWKSRRKEDQPMNVMVLVLDSVSSTDAFRNLPMTMKYLLEELNFTQFSRYHALGEPTFLNAMPLLIGQNTRTFFRNKQWNERWDNIEFIWKAFDRSKYATAYMEDIPAAGTFNYGEQKGFLYAPTDFYPRPLFCAWEDLRNKNDDKSECVGSSTMWNYLYNYELEILEKLNGILPSFTMPWLCWPAHDIFNSLNVLDKDTKQFFERIAQNKSVLENTLMVVMGDHGFYSGEYAQTHNGLLERRLPLFILRIPDRLRQLIPNVDSIVDYNSKQVTSHYDTYKTLLHLANLVNPEINGTVKTTLLKSGIGRTLLDLLPEDRTCLEVGIPEQWCICNLPAAEDTASGDSTLSWLSVPAAVQIHRTKDFANRN